MEKENKIGIIGLGYVGLPLACLFATRYKVVGYDNDRERISDLLRGHDSTGEVESGRLQKLQEGNLICTSSETDLEECNVYVVAVPTPVDHNHQPDLGPLTNACRMAGRMLKKGDTVIYESTVYPGMTEEYCVPLLAQTSGLEYNVDFFVGYSPERINPGDRNRTVEKIRKITSGSTSATGDFVDGLYNSVLENGTCRVSSIKIAEAAKIVENTQRDVNIAFMNELAKIFNAMGIDTTEVLDAAATKWNFIRMKPGLVGGHCIGVDPYYLVHQAQVYGVLPRIIMESRRINDGMGTYIASQVMKRMILRDIRIKDARLLLLGFTFKENCPDIRNTKVADIYTVLHEYTNRIVIYDPWVSKERAEKEYGVSILYDIPKCNDPGFDAVVLCVAHDVFMSMEMRSLLKPGGIIYDVTGRGGCDVDFRL